jgi:hypothetical protein
VTLQAGDRQIDSAIKPGFSQSALSSPGEFGALAAEYAARRPSSGIRNPSQNQ